MQLVQDALLQRLWEGSTENPQPMDFICAQVLATLYPPKSNLKH